MPWRKRDSAIKRRCNLLTIMLVYAGAYSFLGIFAPRHFLGSSYVKLILDLIGVRGRDIDMQVLGRLEQT